MRIEKLMLNLFLWAAIIYHFCCGALVLVEPDVVHVTGLSFVHKLFGNYDWLAYFIISITATAGLLLNFNKYFIIKSFLLIPQQFILMLTGIGEAYAAYNGMYPDGYIPKGTGYFIFIDQLPSITLTMGHSINVFWKWYLAATKK